MDRMIFVNLPVADVAASRRFYTGLGFGLNEKFCDDQTVCVVVSDTIVVMLLERGRFHDFITGEISDAPATTEVINCLSATSPAEVDDLVARALRSGGRPWRDKMAEGPLYGHGFTDPDGHVWEVLHMDLTRA